MVLLQSPLTRRRSTTALPCRETACQAFGQVPMPLEVRPAHDVCVDGVTPMNGPLDWLSWTQLVRKMMFSVRVHQTVWIVPPVERVSEMIWRTGAELQRGRIRWIGEIRGRAV